MTKKIPESQKAPAFKMPQSKAKAEEERLKNQAWWDKWDAGDWQSDTYLKLPSVIRDLEGVDLAQYRLKIA
jgi:hypothetical protein